LLANLRKENAVKTSPTMFDNKKKTTFCRSNLHFWPNTKHTNPSDHGRGPVGDLQVPFNLDEVLLATGIIISGQDVSQLGFCLRQLG
jgi:hypothetical protein